MQSTLKRTFVHSHFCFYLSVTYSSSRTSIGIRIYSNSSPRICKIRFTKKVFIFQDFTNCFRSILKLTFLLFKTFKIRYYLTYAQRAVPSNWNKCLTTNTMVAFALNLTTEFHCSKLTNSKTIRVFRDIFEYR